MLVDNSKASHVEFISYTGSYPNLCSGLLTLRINGEIHTFGYRKEAEFPSFWLSGGGLLPDYEGTYNGEWIIDKKDIPEQFKDYAEEIDKIFNENVEYGCCGGCI